MLVNRFVRSEGNQKLFLFLRKKSAERAKGAENPALEDQSMFYSLLAWLHEWIEKNGRFIVLFSCPVRYALGKGKRTMGKFPRGGRGHGWFDGDRKIRIVLVYVVLI